MGTVANRVTALILSSVQLQVLYVISHEEHAGPGPLSGPSRTLGIYCRSSAHAHGPPGGEMAEPARLVRTFRISYREKDHQI